MSSEIILSNAGLVLQGREVLAGVSLRLAEARVGIVGRNGSGKTSFLRLIAGLVAPTSGTVRVAGVDPSRDRKAMLAEIGILFQNPDHQILFPTVGEELAFGLIQQGLARPEAGTRVRAMLAAEGRAHWEGAATHTLSQGQRQYLCLMAVLAMAPQWLLLDEPFAALDLPTQVRLKRRLAGLTQRVVVISHDPEAVAGADRVIWLEAGRVKADGAPGAVLPAFCEDMAQRGRRMLTLTSLHDTVAHRWPAGAKLAALALWTLALFQMPGAAWATGALIAVALAALALGIAADWLRLMRLLWPMAVVLALWHLWSGTPAQGLAAIARMLAAVGAANLVTMTTRLADMQAVFQTLARPLSPVLPPKTLALAVALVIRFVPVMLQRWEALGLAFRARSARRASWRIAMPAVLAALDDAEHVADALRARGGAG